MESIIQRKLGFWKKTKKPTRGEASGRKQDDGRDRCGVVEGGKFLRVGPQRGGRLGV
jgi:hypothetical protein